METIDIKNLTHPDEIRTLPKSKIEVVDIGSAVCIMRATFQPGWKWSECIKPTVGTESCQAAHINYVVSGRIKIRMDDGQEKEMGPGDAADIPPGHDAWVIGDEPCVMIDFTAGKLYGKKQK